jgi:hypothetical protein
MNKNNKNKKYSLAQNAKILINYSFNFNKKEPSIKVI